jgi:hypothetical protein
MCAQCCNATYDEDPGNVLWCNEHQGRREREARKKTLRDPSSDPDTGGKRKNTGTGTGSAKKAKSSTGTTEAHQLLEKQLKETQTTTMVEKRLVTEMDTYALFSSDFEFDEMPEEILSSDFEFDEMPEEILSPPPPVASELAPPPPVVSESQLIDTSRDQYNPTGMKHFQNDPPRPVVDVPYKEFLGVIMMQSKMVNRQMQQTNRCLNVVERQMDAQREERQILMAAIGKLGAPVERTLYYNPQSGQFSQSDSPPIQTPPRIQFQDLGPVDPRASGSTEK